MFIVRDFTGDLELRRSEMYITLLKELTSLRSQEL
jgi:hypothetical protein